MPVADLQVWADQLELERLPEIESRSRALTDQLMAHAIRIDAAQDSAWSAQDQAYRAIGDIYQTGMDARSYTDAAIQRLRDELRGQIGGIGGEIADGLRDELTEDWDRRQQAMDQANAIAIERAEQVARELGWNLEDVRSVSEQILDIELPSQREAIENDALRSINTKGTLDLLLQDFNDPTLLASLDRVRSELEDAVRPLRSPELRLPASNWTLQGASNVFQPKAPPPASWFIEDQDLGDCIALPASAERLRIGPSFHVPYETGTVFKVTIRCKVVARAADGVARLMVGASTWRNPSTLTEHGEAMAYRATQLYETITAEAYVTGDAAKAAVLEGEVLRMTSSSDATRAFIYAVQAGDGSRFRITSIAIRDVTDAVQAMLYANAGLSEAEERMVDIQRDVRAALENIDSERGLEGNWSFAEGWKGWATTTDLGKHPGEMNDIETGVLQQGAQFTGGQAALLSTASMIGQVTRVPVLPDSVIKIHSRLRSNISCVAELVLTTYDILDQRLGEIVLLRRSITQTSYQTFEAEQVGGFGANVAAVRASLRFPQAGRQVSIDVCQVLDQTGQHYATLAINASNEARRAESNAGTHEAEAARSATTAARSRNEAGGFATAASTSANTAASRASDAEQAASTADGHRQSARTAQTRAEQAQSAAARAQQNAEGSAASASDQRSAAVSARNQADSAAATAVSNRNEAVAANTSARSASAAATSARDLAVSVAARGNGVLRDQFCPNEWVSWNTGPNRDPSRIYPAGRRFQFILPDDRDAGVRIRSDSPLWAGPYVAQSFRVEIEFTLYSGSISGAGVLFDFNLSDTDYHRESVRLWDMVPGGAVRNRVTLASYDFVKPSNITMSSIQSITVFLMANYNYLGTKGAKNFEIHSIQIYPITATEAAIQEQRTAIADLEGNSRAGYLIRAQAGSQVSLLSLIAADGSGRGASVAKISASQILLNGSVIADHMSVDRLSAISSTIGLIRTASSGRRTEIRDATTTIYDSNNRLRVRLGIW